MTAAAKDAIAAAFDRLGGTEALVKWAKKDEKNLSVFYASIWTKIIPLQVGGDPDNPLQVGVEIAFVKTDAPVQNPAS